MADVDKEQSINARGVLCHKWEIYIPALPKAQGLSSKRGRIDFRDKGQRRPEQSFVNNRTAARVHSEHEIKPVSILARSEKGLML